VGEGSAALGPQRFRPVQYLRDPSLLGQRRQGNCHVVQVFAAEVVDVDSRGKCRDSPSVVWCLEEVGEVARVHHASGPQHPAERAEPAFVVAKRRRCFADDSQAPAGRGDYNVEPTDSLLGGDPPGWNIDQVVEGEPLIGDVAGPKHRQVASPRRG
jgi:hypothetical protein